ncbi:hypothetical protein QO002_005258 [Pararhizobium capsulatum DSM 1112]|uniref:Uncharacterized protein n=1 Tax=Pararhizobium capsulatum DSM 1112 TaxID=1121113 RepID=A0ABU0BXQ0_9HYPH|nr:hypothetical protein [Pararhizobium capsulatum]MDQ0323052.1 hypothetical protein [Pararhizobium capsulatum DSM 1112]
MATAVLLTFISIRHEIFRQSILGCLKTLRLMEPLALNDVVDCMRDIKGVPVCIFHLADKGHEFPLDNFVQIIGRTNEIVGHDVEFSLLKLLKYC